MKNNLKCLFITGLFFGISWVYGQEEKKSDFQISGYGEAYYQYDFNNPLGNTRPGFVYSHNRNNEVSLNLAYLKGAYNNGSVRANLALAVGSYMNANLSAEPGVLKNIYEGNVGVKISKNHDVWIDAGIFSSHLGFESAVGKDNWTMTRSLFADNSPYFETGAKISYTSADGRLFLSGLILNGWQRIQRVDGNTLPAFGHQISYKPMENLTLNSGSFIGSDKADSVRQMRYFHNFYAIYQISNQVGVTVGFDFGFEQKENNSDSYNKWYTPVVLLKYSPSEKFSVTGRAEYYKDKNGVIISTASADGFDSFGYSVNADYHIFPNVVWRTELRNLSNKTDIFESRTGALKKNSTTIGTALAVSF